MTTPETIAELRRLLSAATPRPWSTKHQRDSSEDWTYSDIRCHPTDAIYVGHPQVLAQVDLHEDDAELIAAAVNALPRLLDDLSKLEDERSALADLLDRVYMVHDAHADCQEIGCSIWNDLCATLGPSSARCSDCGDPIGADVPASWTTCAQCSARSDETADGVES